MSERKLDPALTIHANLPRVDLDLIRAAGLFPTATLHEAAGKIGVLPSAIKPITSAARIAGAAVTVHSPGGDNLWLHRAIYAAMPGDILVVSVSGVYDHGYWGEIMSTAAQQRGLGGLVIDGCVRDAILLDEIGFPVFARGICVRGTGKDFSARGWVNAPTLFDDLTVMPGDLIVGDGDGVVCIPRLLAHQVLDAARTRESVEAQILERLRAGETTLSIYEWN